tara:strand:- start:37 stop:270 length:234 start_codon:yes stop_codon:yes gene_type:complete
MGDVIIWNLKDDQNNVMIIMNLQDIDTSYWKYLEGISYHHLQGYLKELDAEDYFAELFPIVRKKLQACAAVRINQKE